MSISDFEKIDGREYGNKQETEINNDLLYVYPNPATDQIIVKINTQGKVIKPNVIDATGRSVPVAVESISRSMEGVTYAIGLAGMRDGVYVFAVLVNGSYESVKFIVKK